MLPLKSACIASLIIAVAASDAMALPVARHANADIVDGQGQTRGKAMLVQHKDGIHVDVRAVGLPAGVHAVHIHAVGTCTGPDFKSAGGHWNPAMRQHGHDNPMGAHMGDMPNMSVAPDGAGRLRTVVKGASLGGEGGLLDADGASIVVHADPDDYKTDPTGNAGARLACGLIISE